MSVYTPTPILDRRAPLPDAARPRLDASAGSTLVLFVVLTVLFVPVLFVLLPVAMGVWLPAAIEDLRGSWSIARVAGAVVLALAAYLAAVAVHELGHLLGGLAARFRYHSVRIGPFQFDRRFALTLDRKLESLYSGMSVIVPVTTRSLARRGFVMVAAGPLANILAACLVYALPFSRGIFWNAFIAASILNGLAELIPMRSAVGCSDGKILAGFLRRPAWSERWLALIRLRVDFLSQTPPEALCPAFLAKAVAIRDPSVETILAHSLAYANAFHRNQTERAAHMLEVCLAHIGHATPEARDALISDAAVFQAEKRRNPELARQWLESLRNTGAGWDVLRVEASILEAEGNIEATIAKLKECEAAATALPEGFQRTWLLGVVARWQARLRAA